MSPGRREGPEPHELTELQLAVVATLWEEGDATVNRVRERLADAGRRLARTTVATLLSRLEDRGVVRHQEAGREFVYRPLVSEDEVRRERVDQLAERLFDGDVPALVSQLLDVRRVGPEELARVRRLIEQREAELAAEEKRA